MWDEAVQFIDGDRVVNAGKDDNEMLFECLDGPFDIVVSVDVRYCELITAVIAA